jgi:hypothetical protein
MAPFNVHFLIAEKIWPELDGRWQPFYGQFCFGCIAPDVDKLSACLTQKETHFFDRTGDYDLMATHRSVAFLRQQADFLARPFSDLPPEAQAFALGYLCHLCVDEVSKHMWRRDIWLQFKHLHPGTAFAALDESARQQTQDFPAVVGALCAISMPRVIPRIPPHELLKLWRGVCNFVQAKSIEEEFMALVDMFDRPTPELRQQRRQRFRTEMSLARAQINVFQLGTLVRASLARSRSRLADLMAGRIPEPDYPLIEA